MNGHTRNWFDFSYENEIQIDYKVYPDDFESLI